MGQRVTRTIPRWQYYEYINSDAWQQRRTAYLGILKSQRCRVRRCKNFIANVHHRTYNSLGVERNEDLVGLCREHHQVVHDYYEGWKRRFPKRANLATATNRIVKAPIHKQQGRARWALQALKTHRS